MIALATRNRGKVAEFSRALSGMRLVPILELSGIPEVVEDGETFEQNAVKKARAVCESAGMAALADDSGLAVDALDGAPGVRSARLAGEGADDAANRAELLRRLDGVPARERTARFLCVLAVATREGILLTVTGRCEGRLLDRERGSEGFGYDPLFVPEGESRTFAEMTGEEKAARSHRGKALAALAPLLPALRLDTLGAAP